MTKFRKTACLIPCLILGFFFLFIVDGTRGEAAVQQASANQPGADEEKIKQLERDRQDAFVRNDIDALDRETASEYTTINGTGKLSTKPQMMQNLRGAKTRVLSVKLDQLKARVYGDTAVLTGEYRDVNVREGIQRETHALFMRIFVKTNGHWQAVAYQQTPVLDQ